MAKENQNKKSKIGIILFAVLIPLFLLVIAGTVAYFMLTSDSDNWLKTTAGKIPVISSVVSSDGGKEKDTQAKLDKANERISSQKDEIEDLKKEITSMEGIIEDQELDIKKLSNQNQDADTDGEAQEGTDANNEVKKVASSFRKMEPEKAAGIVGSMDKTTAINVLQELSGDVRGGILAEMEPKKAAEIMEGMLK